MPSAWPRWSAVLLLPLLVGALLLMHGLDAGAASGAAHASVDADHHAHDDGRGCDGCVGAHVVSACVGVVVAVVSVRAVRRLVASVRTIATGPSRAERPVRASVELLRPPEPAWVRLAVMRC